MNVIAQEVLCNRDKLLMIKSVLQAFVTSFLIRKGLIIPRGLVHRYDCYYGHNQMAKALVTLRYDESQRTVGIVIRSPAPRSWRPRKGSTRCSINPTLIRQTTLHWARVS